MNSQHKRFGCLHVTPKHLLHSRLHMRTFDWLLSQCYEKRNIEQQFTFVYALYSVALMELHHRLYRLYRRNLVRFRLIRESCSPLVSFFCTIISQIVCVAGSCRHDQ